MHPGHFSPRIDFSWRPPSPLPGLSRHIVLLYAAVPHSGLVGGDLCRLCPSSPSLALGWLYSCLHVCVYSCLQCVKNHREGGVLGRSFCCSRVLLPLASFLKVDFLLFPLNCSLGSIPVLGGVWLGCSDEPDSPVTSFSFWVPNGLHKMSSLHCGIQGSLQAGVTKPLSAKRKQGFC